MISLKEASNMVSAVHFASIIVLFISIFMQVLIEFTLSKQGLRLFSRVLAMLISGSSWVYEAILIPFLALVALVNMALFRHIQAVKYSLIPRLAWVWGCLLHYSTC
jgi:hypothetical protein